GRRNQYTIQDGSAQPDRVSRIESVGDLLAILTGGTGRSLAMAAKTSPGSRHAP
ncbi:MAG: hypothetical protein QOC91_1475, partial [Solirubrobacteraceae bacterium]|nr:hypothetical protein [Solirubrobacteraceae bacterium]